MSSLYPLRFESLFKRYVWGGRRLGTMLGKPIGPGEDYAESWEVVDHHDGQSVVAFGDHAGRSLGELVQECGQDLFGRDHLQPRFPLLFKFLDANRPLSVQVHPSDEQGFDDSKLNFIMELKNVKRGRIKEYKNKYAHAHYEDFNPGASSNPLWDVKCDIALPCATQNEIDVEDADHLVKSGCCCVGEGANMPCTPNAVDDETVGV